MTQRPVNNPSPSGGADDSGSVVPPEVRSLRAALRGGKAKAKSGTGNPSPQAEDIFPKAAKLKRNRALRNAKIGEAIKDKGIYAGTWQPKNRDGQTLSQKFHVFAAPKNLVMTFTQAVKKLSEMKDWYGHNGFDHRGKGQGADEVLFKALEENSYAGEWFIPPYELVKNNLYQNREAFNGAASLAESNASYLSCEDGSKNVKSFNFHFGSTHLHGKSLYRSIRLVRLEPVL